MGMWSGVWGVEDATLGTSGMLLLFFTHCLVRKFKEETVFLDVLDHL